MRAYVRMYYVVHLLLVHFAIVCGHAGRAVLFLFGGCSWFHNERNPIPAHNQWRTPWTCVVDSSFRASWIIGLKWVHFQRHRRHYWPHGFCRVLHPFPHLAMCRRSGNGMMLRTLESWCRILHLFPHLSAICCRTGNGMMLSTLESWCRILHPFPHLAICCRSGNGMTLSTLESRCRWSASPRSSIATRPPPLER